MPECVYHVDIRKTGTEKNTKVTGHLTCIFSEYDTASNYPFIPIEKSVSLEFNPLTILGDLRNREKPYEYTYERLNIDRSWKYLLGSYEYEYGFGEPLYIGNDEQYLKFVSNLDKIMRSNQCTTLEDLGTIKNAYKFEHKCNISVDAPNLFFDLTQKKTVSSTRNVYRTLEYKFGETNEELVNCTYLNRNHQFSYHCPAMADVIFSILHFIVIHKYKFKTCALCQKRYAKIPNQGQGKYCSRKSPLGLNSEIDPKMRIKFTDLDCQSSMRKYHEIIRNEKKNRLRYIPNDKGDKSFHDEFNKYYDKSQNSPTVKNLIELYSFVNQYKFNT